MMYSFFLMFCFVIYVCTKSNGILFETENKCGCFFYDKCPHVLKPNCSIENDNYEDLYQQNLPPSKSPELCSKWFLEGFKKQLITSENGTLKISMLFSPKLNQKIVLSVHLSYRNQCLDIYNSSQFYLLGMKHSTKYVMVRGRSTDSCKKTVEISFPFVFSGCYQLHINNRITKEIIDGCMSRPFSVATSYKKTPIDNITMIPSYSYVAQNESLKFTFVSEGLNSPKSILIRLKNINFSKEKVVKEAHLTSVQRGDCCHGFEHPFDDEPHNMTYVPCEWQNDVTLNCIFYQIKNGNYCVFLHFIDQRCDDYSLWINNSCVWKFCSEAKGQVSSTETKPYEVNHLYSTVILYCLFVILGTAGVIFMVYYFRKEKHPLIITNNNLNSYVNSKEKSRFISEKEEILLLYPRDCDKFMAAMKLFRMLLKECCGCKVHDAWDDNIFDEVADSIETWSLPLIHDEKTKIVVVLTDCSKIIEESYISSNNFATYRDPKAFDSVFAQSIKVLNEIFATRFDSYQRVFVVRLDETPIIDFSFHFNRSTVYILPHGLQTLVDDIQNGHSTPINKEIYVSLMVAIHEYQTYKQQFKNYLHDILNINNMYL